MFNNLLAKIIYKPLYEKILDKAFKKVSFSYDPVIFSILKSTKHAKELGYLPSNKNVNINDIVDLSILNSLLKLIRKKVK